MTEYQRPYGRSCNRECAGIDATGAQLTGPRYLRASFGDGYCRRAVDLGSAIGLSAANFRGGTGASPIWIAIAAASWLLWVEVSSMMCGGYLTGHGCDAEAQ